MNKLVIDHSYSLGIAWDKTDYRNHGLLHQVLPGASTFRGSLSFSPRRSFPGSAIIIPTSKSLQEIGSIKIRCMIYSTARGGGAARQNIVEGHLSFAFFINSDLSLQGTFLDPNNNWTWIHNGIFYFLVLDIRISLNLEWHLSWRHTIRYFQDSLQILKTLSHL